MDGRLTSGRVRRFEALRVVGWTSTLPFTYGPLGDTSQELKAGEAGDSSNFGSKEEEAYCP